jgi:hypothetical protein
MLGGAKLAGLASRLLLHFERAGEVPMSEESVKNVVLMHGGFVGGWGWQGVYELPAAEGYSVRVVQNPTLSLEGDVAVPKLAIADCDGPVVLVADSQVPWGVGALEGAVTQPAWRVLPWYLIATDDQMIPPAAQHAMSERAGSSVTEVAASHSVYVSQPQAVASLIKGGGAGRLAGSSRVPPASPLVFVRG